MLPPATRTSRKPRVDRPGRASSARQITRGLGSVLSLFALLLLAVTATPPASALGPPSNPLRILLRYDVAWLDSNSGAFGGNLTFFQPLSAPSAAGWSLMFQFSTMKDTAMQGFTDQQQWVVAKDQRARYMAVYLGGPAGGTGSSAPSPDVAAMDAANGIRRFSLFFNGTVTPPATLGDLAPARYAVFLPNSTQPNGLLPDRDFVNTPIRADVPSQPFGPYTQSSSLVSSNGPGPFPDDGGGVASVPVSSHTDVDIDDPSPNGTRLVAPPIGIGLYSAVFFLAGSAFAYGTYQRSKYRQDFFGGHRSAAFSGQTTYAGSSKKNIFAAGV